MLRLTRCRPGPMRRQRARLGPYRQWCIWMCSPSQRPCPRRRVGWMQCRSRVPHSRLASDRAPCSSCPLHAAQLACQNGMTWCTPLHTVCVCERVKQRHSPRPIPAPHHITPAPCPRYRLHETLAASLVDLRSSTPASLPDEPIGHTWPCILHHDPPSRVHHRHHRHSHRQQLYAEPAHVIHTPAPAPATAPTAPTPRPSAPDTAPSSRLAPPRHQRHPHQH